MHITYKNSKISFHTEGQGDAVVLLHGFTGSTGIWDAFVLDISARNQVIVIDLPGHGNSECWGEVHTMQNMGSMVKKVLDRLGIERAVVIGHSMGGYIALAMAKLYPQLIAGLGLFHSTALADSTQAKENRERAINLIRRNHKDFLIQFIPELFSPDTRSMFSREIAYLIAQAKQMTPEAIVAAQKGMMQRDENLEVLMNAPFPVMFIAGQKDSRIPFDSILPQITLAPQAYSLTLRNCGHMGFIEAREQCLEFTKAFIRACYNTPMALTEWAENTQNPH